MLRWSGRDARRHGPAGGWVRAAAVAAALGASLAAVSACASGPATSAGGAGASSPVGVESASPSPSAAHPGSSPPVVPVGGAPNIAVVRLTSRFTPGTLRLGTGQKFAVIVSKDIKPSGSGISGPCTPAAAAQFSSSTLSLRCSGSSYLYTALRAGTTALAVTVRPFCKAGAMCPQWVSVARLTLRIS
jgi:hypothetical protein